MSDVIQLAPPIGSSARRLHDANAPIVRTDAVNVVFTTPQDTLAALRVASAVGKAMSAPLRLVQFRSIPYPMSVDAPSGLSAVEADEFVERVRAEGVDLRVRVYLCRDERRVMPLAFGPHSFIVLGGRRSWWPTPADRLRKRLEAAGHFVVFVDGDRASEGGRRAGEPPAAS